MTTGKELDGAQERADFLQALSTHRSFLRQTVEGLTDEQARERTTVSELCLGGLIKHVTSAERRWTDFIVRGSVALGGFDEASIEAHAAGFRMEEEETLAILLERYEEVARATEELIASVPSLDASHGLPAAPWSAPGAWWTARRLCCT
jgi:uncharacterized damage-inducible protein DinB